MIIISFDPQGFAYLFDYKIKQAIGNGKKMR
jgi:hypothetical protein